MKKIIALFAALPLVLCGCGAAPDDLPEDTPYNSGRNAVMETENGYYVNAAGIMCLRYHDKATDTQIYLCPKPECRHDGNDACAATYKYLKEFNSVLYNGSIYILTGDSGGDNVSVSLYRAAPDGSSLDRITDIFSVNNPSAANVGFDMKAFIIHKGKAYVPYGITVGGTRFSGLCEVDIRNGAKKELLGTDGTSGMSVCNRCIGCGDSIYFDTMRGDAEICRYDINTGEMTAVREGLLSDAAIADDVLYTYREGRIVMYDLNSSEEKMLFDISDVKGYIPDILVCDGRIFVYGEDKVKIFSSAGEPLGETDVFRGAAADDSEKIRGISTLKSSGGKLYEFMTANQTDMSDYRYIVYSCPIDDVISGAGEWRRAYHIIGWWSMEDPEKAYAALF